MPCCVSFRQPGVVGGLRSQYPGLGREFCHLCHLSVLIVFISHDSMTSLHHSFVVLQHSPCSAVEPAICDGLCISYGPYTHCRVVLVFVQVWWLTLVAVSGVMVCLPCIAAHSLSSLANRLLALRYTFASVASEAEPHSWQICHNCFRRWPVGLPAPGEALRRSQNCTTRCSH